MGNSTSAIMQKTVDGSLVQSTFFSDNAAALLAAIGPGVCLWWPLEVVQPGTVNGSAALMLPTIPCTCTVSEIRVALSAQGTSPPGEIRVGRVARAGETGTEMGTTGVYLMDLVTTRVLPDAIHLLFRFAPTSGNAALLPGDVVWIQIGNITAGHDMTSKGMTVALLLTPGTEIAPLRT